MPDKVIFFTVTTLITIGVVFSYSLTPFLMVRFSAGEFNFVLKQFIFSVMSIFIIWAVSRLNPDKWLFRIGMSMFLGGLFLMVIMNFLPSSIVPTIGGASRWISIFGFSIAPVEFFKIGFIYFISWSMARKIEVDSQHRFRSELLMFLPYLIIFIISVFFITVLQKDLGQSVILGGTLILLSYLAGGSGKFIAKVIGFLTFVFLLFIVSFSHRTERIQSWWQLAKTWLPDWFSNMIGVQDGSEPYQVSQALGSIYNGGFFGTGLGNGIFKYGFLAEVHTDFILEGIAEELGIFAIMIIFMLFIILFQRILKVANRSENKIYLLFNIGIALIIGLALLINTYGSTGLIPMKGIPVPFLSYGGSSMLALAFGIGMVLMTSKHATQESDKPAKPETSSPDSNKRNIQYENYPQHQPPPHQNQQPNNMNQNHNNNFRQRREF